MEKFIRERIGLHPHTNLVHIKPAKGAIKHQCYMNCDRALQNSNGHLFKSQLCWIVYTRDDLLIDVKENKFKVTVPEGSFEAELHCILRHKYNGTLFDITPDKDKTRTYRRIVFEPRLSLQGLLESNCSLNGVNNICSRVWKEMSNKQITADNFFKLIDRM